MLSDPKGCCTSCSSRLVAVYAATATGPKVFTTRCSAVVEIAIRLHCSASGRPSFTELLMIFRSGFSISRPSRK